MRTSTELPAFDAIIVAGARSERLGGADKALIDIGGRTLLARAVEATAAAQRTIVVGPYRDGYDVTWCREEPPDGGPVAAFATGLELTAAPLVVLLAVDLPFVGAALPDLLATITPAADAVLLVDEVGRSNYLASVWHRDAALDAIDGIGEPNGASMRKLVAGAQTLEVADRGGWSADCDTWENIEAARTRAAEEA